MTASPRVPWVVGVTGASGTAYAAAVIRALLAAGDAIDLVVSRAARLTLLVIIHAFNEVAAGSATRSVDYRAAVLPAAILRHRSGHQFDERVLVSNLQRHVLPNIAID